jgi:hypothetical protein
MMIINEVIAAVAAADEQTISAVAIGTGIAGLISPLLTALLNQPAFTSQTRLMVATGVSVVLGVLAVFVTGGFEGGIAAAGAQILAVVGVSQTLYALILKPTGLGDAITNVVTIPALEARVVAKREAGAGSTG